MQSFFCSWNRQRTSRDSFCPRFAAGYSIPSWLRCLQKKLLFMIQPAEFLTLNKSNFLLPSWWAGQISSWKVKAIPPASILVSRPNQFLKGIYLFLKFCQQWTFLHNLTLFKLHCNMQPVVEAGGTWRLLQEPLMLSSNGREVEVRPQHRTQDLPSTIHCKQRMVWPSYLVD